MLEFVYENVHGTAEYSDSDKCWHGKMLNTDALITYEADSYNDLREAFKQAVIDWQKTRKEILYKQKTRG